jgi:hypothetical protein
MSWDDENAVPLRNIFRSHHVLRTKRGYVGHHAGLLEHRVSSNGPAPCPFPAPTLQGAGKSLRAGSVFRSSLLHSIDHPFGAEPGAGPNHCSGAGQWTRRNEPVCSPSPISHSPLRARASQHPSLIDLGPFRRPTIHQQQSF